METELKILIAEHDLIDIELIHHELQKSGVTYTYQVAKNRNDYIKSLQEFVPDIILSDFTFPSFDGPTAFNLREKIAPDTPFIFVSGTIGEERSVELIKSGVTDYCLKDKLFTLNPKVIRALNESKAHHQKKQIAQELMQSEKWLAQAQQLAHMGNWIWNFATDEFHWSDEMYRIFGLPLNQDMHSLEYFLSFVFPGERELVTRKINESRNSLNNFSICYCIVQNSGILRDVCLDGYLEFDAESMAVGFFGIVHDITEKVLLENTLARERLNIQTAITDAVLTAQENERSEIGTKLHDNINQILGATKLFIELAKTDAALKDVYLEKSLGYIAEVIDQLRKISKGLITPRSDSMGLFDSIRILKDDLMGMHAIQIRIQVDNILEKDLGEKLQLNIYRIIQEQLNNVVQHAKAAEAVVSLSRRGDEIILIISDNGIGCNTSKASKGLGIRNIMSRADFFHGSAKIKSRPGKGYELKVELPYYWLPDKMDELTPLTTGQELIITHC